MNMMSAEHLDETMPGFSVLLPVYHKDDPGYLDQALQSLGNQTLIPPEIVVVKDGILGEDLERVIGRFKQDYPGSLRVVALPENGGLARALNEGLKTCSYDLVGRMDSDDICHPERFERQISFFAQNPELDVAGANIQEFSREIGDLDSFRNVPENHEEILSRSRTRCPINHVSIVYRKSKVLRVGGYDPMFGTFEDYPLWVKMLQNGSRFHNLQEVLMFVRVDGLGMLKRRKGFKYAQKEWLLANYFFRLKHINLGQYFIWIFIRIPSRLIPSRLLHLIYRNILRKPTLMF